METRLTDSPAFFTKINNSEDVPAELADDFIEGRKELKAAGLSKQKAQVCVLLDVSLSMQTDNQFFVSDDKRNKVQEALNRILALSFSLDDNQQIDIIPFGKTAYSGITVNRKNYKQATNLVWQSLGFNITNPDQESLLEILSEKTNYAAALKAMRKHYFNNDGICQKVKSNHQLPVFALLLTDGQHNLDEEEAENQFKFSSYQNVFIKSIGLTGKELTKEQIKMKFKFLDDMDDAKSSNQRKKPPKELSCWQACCGTIDVDEGQYTFCIDNNDFVCVVDPSKLTSREIH